MVWLMQLCRAESKHRQRKNKHKWGRKGPLNLKKMHEWNRKDNSYMMNRSYGEINKRHDRLNLAVRLISLAIFAVIILSILIF